MSDDELRDDLRRALLQFKLGAYESRPASEVLGVLVAAAEARLADLEAKRQREEEDALPVTEEWYRELGGRERDGWYGLWIGSLRWMKYSPYEMLTIESKILMQVNIGGINRRQVRRLLEALGMDLLVTGK